MAKRSRDPFEDWREWQDHRYDPGYFLGGRIHPLYKVKRPSPFGWIFLISGAFTLAFGFAALKQQPSYDAIMPGLLGLLMILVGFRMLAKRPGRRSAKKDKGD